MWLLLWLWLWLWLLCCCCGACTAGFVWLQLSPSHSVSDADEGVEEVEDGSLGGWKMLFRSMVDFHLRRMSCWCFRRCPGLVPLRSDADGLAGAPCVAAARAMESRMATFMIDEVAAIGNHRQCVRVCVCVCVCVSECVSE